MFAKFKWHTPNTPNKHYCLQVECRHPDDKNPNNNLGQENTLVDATSAGARLVADAVLWNASRSPQVYRITADAYSIPKGEITLDLEARERRLVSSQPIGRMQSLMLTRDPRRGLTTAKGHGLTLVSYAYRGWEGIGRQNERGQHPIPPDWRVHVEGGLVDAEGGPVVIDPGQSQLSLMITVPPDSPPGIAQQFNLSAYNEAMKLVGGLTIQAEVT